MLECLNRRTARSASLLFRKPVGNSFRKNIGLTVVNCIGVEFRNQSVTSVITNCKTQIILDHHLQKYIPNNSTICLTLTFSQEELAYFFTFMFSKQNKSILFVGKKSFRVFPISEHFCSIFG